MTFGRAGLLVYVVLIGCTTPNPRSCKDGLCTDQRFPFCDVDGSFQGQPETCIEVSCTSGEFVACRGDTALTCNASGNDYDLVQCERGCDATSGCRSCTADDQCVNPMPVCDTGVHRCRGCQQDSECPSTICNTTSGSCIPESDVVFASATGVDAGTCSKAQPCSLTRAVSVATIGGVSTLKMLPGTYAQPILVDMAGAPPLLIVANGAVLGATSGVRVTNGASVELRGIEVRSDNNVSCGNPTPGAARTTLTFEDSVIAVSSAGSMVNTANCLVRMHRVRFLDATGTTVVLLGTDTEFEGDRLLFETGGIAINTTGRHLDVTVTNSIFRGASIYFGYIDDAVPGSALYFAFNTFVDAGLSCGYQGSTNTVADVQYENNIIAESTSPDAIDSQYMRCTLTNNIIYPQETARPNNINADPQFVNAAGGDFHLLATSPAVDSAVPSAGLDPAHDFEGTARPQGAAKDIGAFERVP